MIIGIGLFIVALKEIDMKNTAEQFTATHKATLQALQGFTTQAFAGMEKLVELNMAASKAMMEESFSHTQAMLAAKDPKELLALQAGLIAPLADKTTCLRPARPGHRDRQHRRPRQGHGSQDG